MCRQDGEMDDAHDDQSGQVFCLDLAGRPYVLVPGDVSIFCPQCFLWRCMSRSGRGMNIRSEQTT